MIKEQGLKVIDGRTREGKIANTWRRSALDGKGGRKCPYHVRNEIKLATFDLWLALHLQGHIIVDTRKRGTPINRRTGRLPKVHEQYDSTIARFDKRCERLAVDNPKLPNPFANLISGGLG